MVLFKQTAVLTESTLQKAMWLAMFNLFAELLMSQKALFQ